MTENSPEEVIGPVEPSVQSEANVETQAKITATEQEIKSWPLSETDMVQSLRQRLAGLTSQTEAQPIIADWLKEAEDRNVRVYDSILTQVPAQGLSEEGNQTTIAYLQKQLKEQAELIQTLATGVLQEYKTVPAAGEVAAAANAEWLDDTGIKFSRELSPEEMKLKDQIDDEAMAILSAKAKARLKETRFKQFNLEQEVSFIDQYVAAGLRQASMIKARKKLYNDLKLPVVE
jgi:hypothetical protein